MASGPDAAVVGDGVSTPLYKTVIVIWSEYDGEKVEIEDLAFQATEGNAYCSKQQSVLVQEPTTDPEWDGTEFFRTED
jgi:hypothetical protein